MGVSLSLGDITHSSAEAIVNAANSQLLPGGGVCGAIHAAAGPQLAQACSEWVRDHGPVATGCSAITPGFSLHARYVIHTVGPVWSGGSAGESRLLARAYRSAVELADEHQLATVAFPSISTGTYGFPVDLAAPVALLAVAEALLGALCVRDATFVLFDSTTYAAYERALGAGA